MFFQMWKHCSSWLVWIIQHHELLAAFWLNFAFGQNGTAYSSHHHYRMNSSPKQKDAYETLKGRYGGLCRYCCKDGHWKAECPERLRDQGIRCFNCTGIGHTAHACPSLPISTRGKVVETTRYPDSDEDVLADLPRLRVYSTRGWRKSHLITNQIQDEYQHNIFNFAEF